MDIAILVSIASAATAVIAVALTIRQTRLMARQTVLPVVLESFREARSPEWFAARDWIFERLADECPPDRGISGLPEPGRSMVRKIGFLYDNLGLLVAHEVVSPDLVIGFFGEGMDRQWRILEPYIRKEAELTGVGYMVFFEDLVRRHRERPIADLRRRLGLRRLGSGV